jgi:hypothetical protein
MIAMKPPDVYELAKLSSREPPQAPLRVYAKATLQLAWETMPNTIDEFVKEIWPRGDWPVFDLIVE